ncbi:MAG: amidohydrolase family protein [Bryobacteraceae bacterium]
MVNFGRRWFLSGAVAPAASWAANPAASAMEKSLAAELDKIRLYNVHEHLIPEQERVSQRVDFFTLASHYALNDVISAGLAGDKLAIVRDPKASLEQRWKAFEPYWKPARFTGYGQALSIAIAGIYDVEDISAATIGRIDDAIQQRNRPGLYDLVLKERAGIDWCLVDAYWNRKPAPLDKPYFLLSQRFDGFVTPASRKDVAGLEEISGASIHTLADLKKALENTFEQALKVGMAAVKSGLAYRRDLLFQEVSAQDAAADFEAMLKGGVELPRGFHAQKQRPFRRLEDHMFHHLAGLAEARGVPFQIHTGLTAGNTCFVENTNPVQLEAVFHRYPRVRFDLLHIGFPYQQEMGVLAKVFPNVYADFTWAHIISPAGSQRTLEEYLEVVPVNKILGFGGDYRYPELTYGHARIARKIVTKALAGKVEAGLFNEEQALQIGRMLLRENGVNLFGVKAGRG